MYVIECAICPFSYIPVCYQGVGCNVWIHMYIQHPIPNLGV